MDLCDAVPFFSMDQKLREEIWDDGLHLTKAGYKMMANAISARMIELLSGEEK
jgi:lysophospholipase L1-like esterase